MRILSDNQKDMISLLTVILCCPNLFVDCNPINKPIILSGNELIDLPQPLKHVKRSIIELEKKLNTRSVIGNVPIYIDVYKLKRAELDILKKDKSFGTPKQITRDLDIFVYSILQYKVSVGVITGGIDLRLKINATPGSKSGAECLLVKLDANKLAPHAFKVRLVNQENPMIISNDSTADYWQERSKLLLIIYDDASDIREVDGLVEHIYFNVDPHDNESCEGEPNMCHIGKAMICLLLEVPMILVLVLVRYSGLEWPKNGAGHMFQYKKVTSLLLYSIINFRCLFQILIDQKSRTNRLPIADQVVANQADDEIHNQSQDEKKQSAAAVIVSCEASCETVKYNTRSTNIKDENIDDATTVQTSTSIVSKYTRLKPVAPRYFIQADGEAYKQISSLTQEVQIILKPYDDHIHFEEDPKYDLLLKLLPDMDILDKKIEVKLFLDIVASKIPLKWKDFGKTLGLPISFLDCLQEENLTCERRFISVVREWERTECSPSTWRTVLKIILRGDFIHKQTDVANDIVKHLKFNVNCFPQLNGRNCNYYWIKKKQKQQFIVLFVDSRILDMEVNVPLFLNMVASKIQSKWEDFGAMLGLNLSFLECLPEEKSYKKRFISLLREWRKTECSPFTWRTVLGILVGDFICIPIVAYDLVEQLKFITCSPYTKCIIDYERKKKQQELFSSSRILDMKIDEILFFNMVASKIPSKWEEFGVMVGLNLSFLECLPVEEKRCSKRFYVVIYEWKKTESLPFIWRTVIEILNGNFLCERKVANDLVAVINLSCNANADHDQFHFASTTPGDTTKWSVMPPAALTK